MASGNIQKRTGSQGTAYRVRVEYAPDPVTGKRRQRSQSFKTRKEAERALSKWLTEIERGTAVDTSKATIAEHMNLWLDAVAQHNVRATTLSGYRATVERHIIPRLGSILVQRITPAQIQACYSAMLADGKGPRTVQLAHLRLQQALALAVQWNILARNPCDLVKPPRNQRKELRTWSIIEVQSFLSAAQDDAYAPLWMIALTTGLRRGELLGLRWKDINLVRGTLTVQQTVSLLNDAPIIQQPKTTASRRTLRLPPQCLTALQAHKDRRVLLCRQSGQTWDEEALVFASATDTVIHPRNLVRNFDLIVKKAGVPRIRFHDLRHTYATLSLSGGADIKTVSALLGHSSIQVTGDVYAHVTPEMDDRATAAIERAVFGVA